MNLVEKMTILGSIPEEWEAFKLEDIFKLRSGDGLSKSNLIEGDYPVYGGNGVTFYHGNFNYDESKLIIGRVGAKCGCIHRTEKYSWITDNALVIDKSLKEYNSFFLEYILNKIDLNQYANKNAQPVISGGKIYPLIIPFPPLQEQQKIAEILSTVDNKIETIDKQIIETQELKKGLMQSLLTKGIGHTEFKDSSLGLIPKSWELIPIYELRNKNDRYGFTGGPFGSDLKSEHYTKTGVKIIQLQNIGEGKFIDKGIAYTSENKADELHSCNIFPNEIILAKMAPVARCCKVPATDDRYVMCSDGIRLSIDTSKYDNEFVFQALNSKYFRDEAESKSTGTTRARIGLKELKVIPILIPKDIEEQKKIANILRTVDEKSEVLHDKKHNYQELKQGLIQQLLTGKIRVKI